MNSLLRFLAFRLEMTVLQYVHQLGSLSIVGAYVPYMIDKST